MKYIIIAVSLLLMVSCRPEFKDLNEVDREKALQGITSWNYADTERVNNMKLPVVIVSKALIEHDAFGDKYTTANITVKDGSGKFYTIYGTSFISFKVGDVIRNE